GASQAGGPITSISLFSTSGSSVTAPTVRFAHLFKDGDVPSGQILALTTGGQSVPYTAARRNLWPDGSLRAGDLLLKLPANVPSSSALTVNIAATSGSWSSTDALPNGVSIASAVSDITSNNDDVWLELFNVTTSSGTNQGSYHASLHSAAGGAG